MSVMVSWRAGLIPSTLLELSLAPTTFPLGLGTPDTRIPASVLIAGDPGVLAYRRDSG